MTPPVFAPATGRAFAGALALACLSAAARAENSHALAGSDTSETSRQAKGLPWIAHSSADFFYLSSPAASGGSAPYQMSTYQGFTIQSFSFASFHAGWRFRETLAEGLREPYRELFALKLLGTAEVVRDHLFVAFGGNIPLTESRVAASDSLALFRSLNGYSPLPVPNWISPLGLQAGVFGRYRLGAWNLMGSFAFIEPSQFEPIAGSPFHPASTLAGSLRAVLETRVARHRFDFKVSRYGQEETLAANPAHQEGGLYQIRYAWLRSFGRTAWQLGGGGAVKLPDANRPRFLPTALESSETNDNIQRAHAEAAWTWSPTPNLLWRAWLVPKALLEWSTREQGHETELGLALGLRVFEVHRLRLAGNLLYGAFQDRTYLGVGARAEFAFRHLGFQDLEAQGEATTEGRN
ncbi:MAG TPA: hypothetical protein VK465_13865 [Fibrobacteria bacterium]|nr:hypothetical protein [Fibrobacteria bacterium]